MSALWVDERMKHADIRNQQSLCADLINAALLIGNGVIFAYQFSFHNNGHNISHNPGL